MIDIYSVSGNVLLSPLLGSDAERVEELMASDYVQLAWQSDSGQTLPAGTYIMLDGEKYSLLDPYEPEQKDEVEYSYRPQFHSRVTVWGKVPFFHYTYSSTNVISAREPDWMLTDTPANFMSAICRAIKNETGETWTYEVAGDIIPTAVTIPFAATDILSGLNSIATECDTEWRADKATNTLYLGKAQYGSAVTLQVDSNVGVPSVTKSKEGYYNRFYVYGSTRNITQDYQGANVNSLVNKRLTLDPAKYPGGYISLPRPEGVPVYSKTLTFDEVYPHSGLTIANLRARLMYRLDEEQNKIQVGTDAQGNPVYDMYTIWFFQLPGFSLNDTTYSKDNPNGMLIAGKALSAHFKTGALTGREFELIYHSKAEKLRNSDGQDFQVLAGDYEIKFVEEFGYIIPAQTGIVPADGDSVILFNLRMPAEYIATAYKELEEAAMAEIEERYTTDLNNYTLKSNPVAFATADPGLAVGRKITYVNGGYSYTTRVIKLVRKLDIPSEQEITIGNAKIKGNSATLKEEVVNANSNIDVLAQLNQLNQSAVQAYQRTQQMLLDSLAKVENYWFIDPSDPSTIITNYNVLSRKEVTAYGNGDSGSGTAPGVGATRLRMLEDVLLPESGIGQGKVLMWDADARNGLGAWVAGDAGLNESSLAQYLSMHDYAKRSEIPAMPDLTDYATQTWVEGKGYALASALGEYATKEWANQTYQPKGDYALASALGDYVTIATPQEITGQKRFAQAIRLGTADDYIELAYRNGGLRVSGNFVAAGEVTAYGSEEYMSSLRLDALGDVSLGAVAVGEALVWDGSKWTNKAVAAGGLDTTAGDARYLRLAGGEMAGNITMGANHYIYGINETYGSIAHFDGTRTVLGSIGASTTAATLLRSKTGHAQITNGTTTYTMLDTGNYASALDGRYVNASGDSMSGALSLPRLNILGTAESNAYITADTADNAYINVGGRSLMVWSNSTNSVRPSNALPGAISLGTEDVRWGTIYGGSGNFSGEARAASFVKVGGTSSQFLKADGSVDSNSYLKVDGTNGTQAGVSALMRALAEATGVVTDDTLFVTSHYAPSTTNNLFYRRPASFLWSYIQGKGDARYVTLAGAQTITGLKTLGAKVGVPADNGNVNRLCITPYAHTGGPWYINSYDTPDLAWLRVMYGSTRIMALSHKGELRVTSLRLGSSTDYVELSYSNGALVVSKNLLGKGEVTAYGGNGSASGGVSAGATRLRMLEDVLLPESGIANGRVLTYNAATGKWVDGVPGLDTTAGDARYVKKAGDSMSGMLTIKTANFGEQLNIYRNSTTANAVIRYTNAEKVLGYLGFCGGSGAYPYDLYIKKDDTEYRVLHTGNYTGVLDSRYVNASGDSMSGPLSISSAGWQNQLKVIRPEGNPSIVLADANGDTGKLYTSGGVIYVADTVASGEIIHTGNYTSKLDARYVNAAGDTVTGDLTVDNYLTVNKTIKNNNINSIDGNGLLSYHPTAWTGVSDTQWGVGANTSQGVIRSSNASLIHYRAGVGNSTIWDSANDGAGSGLDADTVDGIQEVSLFRDTIASIAEADILTKLPGTRNGTYVINHSGWSGAAVVFHAGASNSGLAFYRPGGSNSMPKILLSLDSSNTWTDKGTILTTSVGNAVSASKLQTARSLWGQSFDGTAAISGNMTGVGNITGSGAMVVSANGRLTLNAASSALDLKFGNDDTKSVILNGTAFKPFNAASHNLTLGSSEAVWERGYIRYLDTDSGYALRICTAGTQRIHVKADGLGVGIGKDTDIAYALDVAGTIGASGEVKTTDRYVSARNANDCYHYYFSNTTAGVAGGIGTSATGPGAYLWLTGANNSWRIATNATERMRITGDGKVLIGLTSSTSTAKLHVGGNFLANGEVTAYSDMRLKSDIEVVKSKGRLRPVTFYKDGSRHVGLIAQDVQLLCPEAVSDAGEWLALNYTGALSYGFAGVYGELDALGLAVSSVRSEVDVLREENRKLKERINILENRLAA